MEIMANVPIVTVPEIIISLFHYIIGRYVMRVISIADGNITENEILSRDSGVHDL